MKRLPIILAVFFLFLTIPAFVFAETETTASPAVISPSKAVGLPNAEGKLKENQQRIEEKTQVLEQQKEERQAQFEERKAMVASDQQERLQNRFTRVTNRFDAAYARMENVIARVRTRMEKLEASGIDTASAEAKLVIAEGNMASAKVLIGQSQTEFKTVLASEEPVKSFQTVKETLKSAKEQMVSARKAISEAVTYLKGLSKEIVPSGTALPGGSAKTATPSAAVPVTE